MPLLLVAPLTAEITTCSSYAIDTLFFGKLSFYYATFSGLLHFSFGYIFRGREYGQLLLALKVAIFIIKALNLY
jgi:hypothetical protein